MDRMRKISIIGGICLLLIGAFLALLFGQYFTFGVLYYQTFIGISLMIVGLVLIVYPLNMRRVLLLLGVVLILSGILNILDTSIIGPMFGYYNIWMIQIGPPAVGIALLVISLLLRKREEY
jgi:hypothetical protein